MACLWTHQNSFFASSKTVRPQLSLRGRLWWSRSQGLCHHLTRKQINANINLFVSLLYLDIFFLEIQISLSKFSFQERTKFDIFYFSNFDSFKQVVIKATNNMAETGRSEPAAATVITLPPIFILNLFLEDINPRTAKGVKLHDKKLSIFQKTLLWSAISFVKEVRIFGWDTLVGSIQINNAGNNLIIILNAPYIFLEHVQEYFCHTWMAFTSATLFNDPMPNNFDAVDVDADTSAVQCSQLYCQTKLFWLHWCWRNKIQVDSVGWNYCEWWSHYALPSVV